MRKRRVTLSLTFYEDSKSLAWHVEHDSGDDGWELWSEGVSTPSSGALDAFESLRRWIEATMGDG